jgi:hypothetical protein
MRTKRQHLPNQTRPEHRTDRGFGTAIFFIAPPKSKDEKMASIRSITYAEAIDRLAKMHGFKWIPYSYMSHSQILDDNCDGTPCPNSPNCPGSCYCGGTNCHSS